MSALQPPPSHGIEVVLIWSGLVMVGLAAMRALLDWGPLLRERRGRMSSWITWSLGVGGAGLLVAGVLAWLLGS
jgi:hypothetical protein